MFFLTISLTLCLIFCAHWRSDINFSMVINMIFEFPVISLGGHDDGRFNLYTLCQVLFCWINKPHFDSFPFRVSLFSIQTNTRLNRDRRAKTVCGINRYYFKTLNQLILMKEKSYSGLNVCQTDIFSNRHSFVFSFQGQVSELAQQGIKLTNYICIFRLWVLTDVHPVCCHVFTLLQLYRSHSGSN